MIDRLWERHAVRVMVIGWTIGTLIDAALLVLIVKAVL